MASALGIPGVLLLYGLFFAVAIVLGTRSSSRKKAGQERLLLAGFWAACAGYLAGPDVRHLRDRRRRSCCGSAWPSCSRRSAKTTPVQRAQVGRAGRLPSLFVLVAALLGGQRHLLPRRLPLPAGARRRPGRWRASSRLERAIELNPYNDMYRAELGLAYTDAAVALYSQAVQSGTPDQQVMAAGREAVQAGRAGAARGDRLRSGRVRQLRLPHQSLQLWGRSVPDPTNTTRRPSMIGERGHRGRGVRPGDTPPDLARAHRAGSTR